MMGLLVIIAFMTFIMYRTAKLERVLVQNLYFEDFPKYIQDIRLFFISRCTSKSNFIT